MGRTIKPPRPKAVVTEIARLREMKPTVRRSSIFGDDHWAAIDAQILVLDEYMDEDELDAAYPPCDADDPAPENVRSAAERALWWRDGDENYGGDGPPSKAWEGLVQK